MCVGTLGRSPKQSVNVGTRLRTESSRYNMTKNDDVKWEHSLVWARYEGRSPSAALSGIYKDASALSSELRSWYWNSIDRKRFWSVWARSVAFALGTLGAVAPLVAALRDSPEEKMPVTQLGFVTLTVAGLVLVGDRVFGWSSGWLRYTATVTAMEQLTMQFDLDWMRLLLTQRIGTSPSASPAVAEAHVVEGVPPAKQAEQPLEAPSSGKLVAPPGVVGEAFALAQTFMQKLGELRTEETQKWIAEFNSGMAVLDEMIKNQREASSRARETTAKAIREVKAVNEQPGALVLTLTRPNGYTHPCSVSLDDTESELVNGASWSKSGVSPGLHKVRVSIEVEGSPRRESSDIVEIAPGQIVRHSMAAP